MPQLKHHVGKKTSKARLDLFFLLLVFFLAAISVSGTALGQNQPSDSPAIERPTPVAEQDSEEQEGGISMLALLFKGGWFMIPLVGLSILIVIITVERFITLRVEKTLPHELIQSLGKLSSQSEGFDPRSAYRICQGYPSIAARVVQAMLVKVGRPISEIESTVSEAAQREADRLQGPIRWLELSAAISPLIGLLGTVWGVTQAFYEMTQLTVGQNKAAALASGIYTALITTICGLMIAIPAIVMFKLLEAKIASLFHRIEELMLNLIPQVERFEGQIRFADPSQTAVGSAATPAIPQTSPGKGERKKSETRKDSRSDSGIEFPTKLKT